MLEVYVDNNIAPMYPNEPPVLALVGGGFSEDRLKQLTDRVKAEAAEKAAEEPGEPQIFNLLTFVGEAAEQIVEEETAELEAAKKKRLEEQKAAAAKQGRPRPKSERRTRHRWAALHLPVMRKDGPTPRMLWRPVLMARLAQVVMMVSRKVRQGRNTILE